MSTATHKSMAYRMLDRAWQEGQQEPNDDGGATNIGTRMQGSDGDFPEDFKEPPGQTYARLPGLYFNAALAETYPIPVRCLHSDPSEWE